MLTEGNQFLALIERLRGSFHHRSDGYLIAGRGTAGYIPQFSAAQELTNSLLSETGSSLKYNGGPGFDSFWTGDTFVLDADGEQMYRLYDAGTERMRMSVVNGGIASIRADEYIGFRNLANTNWQYIAVKKLYAHGDSDGALISFDDAGYSGDTYGEFGVDSLGNPYGVFFHNDKTPYLTFYDDNTSESLSMYQSNADGSQGFKGTTTFAFKQNALGANWQSIRAGQIRSETIVFGSQSTPAYAATISLAMDQNNSHKITTVHATGNATINATNGGTAGMVVQVLIVNDATSGKTITFGTNFRAASTLVGTVSKAAVVTFLSDGTSWFETGRATVL